MQNTTSASPKAKRIGDAARALGIGRTSLYKLTGEGRLKIIRIAGRALVAESEIDRLIDEASNESAAGYRKRREAQPRALLEAVVRANSTSSARKSKRRRDMWRGLSRRWIS